MAPIKEGDEAKEAVANPSGHSVVHLTDNEGKSDISAELAQDYVCKEDPLVESNSSHNFFCRFCWEPTNSADDPLIKSCLCSGGVKFVHFLCLRNWIACKMEKLETPILKKFTWASFECEICKTTFQFRF